MALTRIARALDYNLRARLPIHNLTSDSCLSLLIRLSMAISLRAVNYDN